MRHFHLFTLVLIRMSGLMAIGPVFGQSAIPANVRVMLVLVLSLLIVPILPSQAPLPRTELDYACAAAGELALGFALGLGVFTILSGLQIAGELIDQQAGTALAGVFDPQSGLASSPSSRILCLLGATVFLCMPPMNGHLLMVAALVETFQTMPPGGADVSSDAIELLRDLVHQSLVLGLQVAAPVLATMSLVALSMGFLGRTVPQMNVFIVGFPIRVLLTLLVLALTFTGASQVLVDLVPATIDQLRFALAGASSPLASDP